MSSDVGFIAAVLGLESFAIAIISIAIILKTPAVELFRDRPDARKVHQRQTARAGGFCIIIGFVAALLIWQFAIPHTFLHLHPALFGLLLFVSVCVTVIGLVDDMVLFSISNGAKFLLELVIAWVVTGMAGIRMGEITAFGWSIDLGLWGIPLSMFWIVAVTNALNLIDGIDGLAGTLTVIIMGCIALLALQSGAFDAAIVCLMVVGSTAAFLLFNYSPARIFLGDSGSLFAGMFIGIMSLYCLQLPETKNAVMILPLLIGVPLIDVIAAMARRYVRKWQSGASWRTSFAAMFKPDNEHMHHRLVQRGLSHNQALIVLTLFSTTLTLSAVVLIHVSGFYSAIIIGYLCFAIIVFLYTLDFFDRPLVWFASLFGLPVIPAARPTVMVAAIDLDTVLAHALQHYDQKHFVFHTVARTGIIAPHGGFKAVFLGNHNPDALEKDWVDAQRISEEQHCPVMVITECVESPHSPTARFSKPRNSNARVIFIRKPVYVPVLLKRLETVLHRSIGEGIEKLLRDTQKIRLGILHHEQAR